MIRKELSFLLALFFLLTGCSKSPDATVVGSSEDYKNPQFIILNQYSRLPEQNNARFITGSEMKTLIQEIRESESHPVKKGAYSCPAMSLSGSTPAWEYDLIVHFDHDKTLTFSLAIGGCNFLYDERDDRFFTSYISNIEQYF